MKSNQPFEDEVLQHARDGFITIDAEGRCWKPGTTQRAESRCGRDLGYLELRFTRNGVRYRAKAHRVVFRYHGGIIPAGLTINHKDGVKSNNHPANLEPATYLEQHRHARDVLGIVFGYQSGESNPSAKLKLADVQTIRARRAAGELLTAIARDFGIAFQHVSRIARGGGWAKALSQTE